LHPLTKLALTVLLLTLTFAVPWWASYLVLILGVLPLAAMGQILGPLSRTLWKLVLPFAIPILLIQGFFWGEGEVLFSLGPLSFYRQGLIFAAASIGRIALLGGCFLLLSMTTRIDMLMRALVERGLPSQLLYLVVTTLQLVPRFQAQARRIQDAQRARGLETEGSIWRRGRALIPLTGPLLLASLMDVEERALALEARGFSRRGARTSLVVLEDSRQQAWLRLTLWVLSVMIVLMRLVQWIVQ
jgi:energy-coupling factor transport system permease protein